MKNVLGLVAYVVVGVLTISAIPAHIDAFKLTNENASLKQQLEKAKADAGDPVDVHSLRDGSYVRSQDPYYAFVQWSTIDNPMGAAGKMIPVHNASSKVSKMFVVKNGEIVHTQD